MKISEYSFKIKFDTYGLHQPKDYDNKIKEFAVKVIFNAWRNSPIFMLKNKAFIVSIPHKAFHLFTKHLHARLTKIQFQPKEYKQIAKAVEQAVITRSFLHNTAYLPLFTHPGSHSTLPEYTLVKYVPAEDNHNGIFAKLSIFFKLARSKLGAIPSKEILDGIVRRLSNTDLFPWKFVENGCDTRANLMIQFLQLSAGIPIKCISKLFVISPNLHVEDCFGNRLQWKFHVAPLIMLEDGSRWILDPSLSKNSAISIDNWLHMQHSQMPQESVHVTLGDELYCEFNPLQCTLINTSPLLSMKEHKNNQVLFELVNQLVRKSDVLTLKTYKIEFEKRSLNKLLVTPKLKAEINEQINILLHRKQEMLHFLFSTKSKIDTTAIFEKLITLESQARNLKKLIDLLSVKGKTYPKIHFDKTTSS